MSFRATFRTADNHTVSFAVVLKAVTGPLVIVHGEFSSRSNHQNTGSLLRRKTGSSEEFNSGHHISECLTTAGLGSSKDITTVEDVGNRSRLDLGGLDKAKLFHSLQSLLRKGQVFELDVREVRCT